MEATGQFGDYIGGVLGTLFSLIGIILLYYTLKEQREIFHLERMENRFFEMIKFHRENVQEMKYEEPLSKAPKRPDIPITKAEGKRVFKVIFDQINEAIIDTKPFFNVQENIIYTPEYLKKLQGTPVYKERSISFVELAQINLAYLIVFFGLSKEGAKIISNALNDKYQSNFYLPILDVLQLKPCKSSKYWKIWERINKLSIDHQKRLSIKFQEWKNMLTQKDPPLKSVLSQVEDDYKYFYKEKCKYYKFYGGHQLRLGHYYRHLFQAVNYMNDEHLLTFDNKYKYIKLFRAQLSTYEQAVLFFNSLSFIGQVWELEPKVDKKKKEHELVNKQLITKYDLIRNLPGEYIVEELYFKKYYPDVDYELSVPSDRKILLKRKYY